MIFWRVAIAPQTKPVHQFEVGTVLLSYGHPLILPTSVNTRNFKKLICFPFKMDTAARNHFIIQKVLELCALFGCNAEFVSDLMHFIEPAQMRFAASSDQMQYKNFLYEMEKDEAPYEIEDRAFAQNSMLFRGRDYRLFAAFMELRLKALHLWHTVVTPPPENNSERTELWRAENNSAIMEILRSLNPPNKRLVTAFRSC